MPFLPKEPDTRGLIKVVLNLPEDAPTREETLWAEPLGNQKFKLKNSPWFALGCALDDVILCEETEGQLPRFVRVFMPSGNRCLRIFVLDTPQRESVKREVFDFLNSTDCYFEEFGSGKGLISVTVPSSTKMEAFLLRLEEWEQTGKAEWESGNF